MLIEQVIIAWQAANGRLSHFNTTTGFYLGNTPGCHLFVIFSFEGGLMASPLSHNVGAPDGGPGLPIVNWSKQYGDLRVGWAGNY